METLTFRCLRRFVVLCVLAAAVCCLLYHGSRAEEEAAAESESSPPPGGEDSKRTVEELDKATRKATSFEQYKKLFAENRAIQLQGIKALLQFGNNEQKFNIVKVLLNQIFMIIENAKQNLTIAGYKNGDPFPKDEITRHALSKVLENTALFGDIILRLPDAVHSVYDKEKEWQQLMAWCYNFCKESEVFEGTSAKLLHLMAQESKLIPKDPNFINPFKEAERLERESQARQKVEKKPKQKKKASRGPRLRHTEL